MSNNGKNNHRGRPKYIPSEADKEAVYKLSKKECTEAEIAKALNISLRTFQKYKSIFVPYIKKGREEGEPKNIEDVENALLKICKGFEYEEITSEVTQKGKDIISKHQRKVTKQITPNVGAIVFYLCNRAPEKWKNTQKLEHSGKVETPLPEIFNKIYNGNSNTSKKKS